MANTGFDVFQGRFSEESGEVREGTRSEIASIEIRERAKAKWLLGSPHFTNQSSLWDDEYHRRFSLALTHRH